MEKYQTQPADIDSQKVPWNNWWKLKKQITQEFLKNAQLNNLARCRDLLNKDRGDMVPDINYKVLETGWTAIHFACFNKNEEMIELLLENEANINSRTNFQITPLMICCEQGCLALVKKIVGSGACLNLQDAAGNTALHYACKFSRFNIINFLLQQSSIQQYIVNKENKIPIQYIKNTCDLQHVSNKIIESPLSISKNPIKYQKENINRLVQQIHNKLAQRQKPEGQMSTDRSIQ